MPITITSVVSIFFDTFRPELKIYRNKYNPIQTEEWIKNRASFFNDWTLKSLRNQSFKDFRIFLLCSERSKEVVESYDWPDVEICYDDGKSKYEELDSEYVAVTRIDSDDLFHKDTLKIINENLVLTDKIEKLFMSDYYRWLYEHDVITHITSPLEIEKWSPSYTIIYPKSAYKDWDLFRIHWFKFIKTTCSNPEHILPPNLVCMVRIAESTHHQIWKENPKAKALLVKDIAQAVRRDRELIYLFNDFVKLLNDFGITEEQLNGIHNEA